MDAFHNSLQGPYSLVCLELHALDILAVQVPHRAQHLSISSPEGTGLYGQLRQCSADGGIRPAQIPEDHIPADEAGCIRMDRLRPNSIQTGLIWFYHPAHPPKQSGLVAMERIFTSGCLMASINTSRIGQLAHKCWCMPGSEAI